MLVLALLTSAWTLIEFGPTPARGESVTRFCSEPSLPMEENPPGFKARLGISRTAIAPGGDLRVRVENLGTEAVTYGFEYRLERRRNGRWVKLPVGPFFASKLSTQPASAGSCQQVKLKRQAAPGLYRVSKEVWPNSGSRADARLVRAKFQVRSAAREGTTAARRTSFCGSAVARDLEAPLRALPTGEPLPHVLPFAPPGVEAKVGFREGEESRVAAQGSEVRLELRSSAPAALNWSIQVSVSRPLEDGSPGEVIAESQTLVSSISGESIAVTAPALSSGTYRIDFVFSDQDGARLGSYYEYVQVVPPTFGARLALSRTSVAPGESFKVKIENLGTVPLGYGFLYTLERYQDGRWLQAPQVDHFFMSLSGLRPGGTGRCQTVPIFRAAEPGRYRILKGVQVRSGTGFREKTLVKHFRVRGS